jgi:hypothetical protein
MVFGDDDDDLVVEIKDEEDSATPPEKEEEELEEEEEKEPPAKAKKPLDGEVTEEELATYSKSVQKRINQITARSRTEQERLARERDEAIAAANQARLEANQLKGTVNKSQSTVVEQAKRSATAELAAAKAVYKTAYESGDADAVLSAQERLTTAQLRLNQVNSFKLTPLQVEKEPVKDTPKDVKPKIDPKAEAWTKKNTWFGVDDEKTAFALGVHNKLKKAGVDTSSDEYYQTIDARMKEVFGSDDDDDDTPVKPKKRASAVAPVTRTPGSVKIKLNPRQQALARQMGLTNEQYARELAKIEDKGTANGK